MNQEGKHLSKIPIRQEGTNQGQNISPEIVMIQTVKKKPTL
jgi:hypothetical protein